MDNLSDDEIREQLMNMTINEINEKRLVSKRWRDIVDDDSFWCRLLQRDHIIYPAQHKYTNCQHKYKERTRMIKYVRENMEDIVTNILKNLGDPLEFLEQHNLMYDYLLMSEFVDAIESVSFELNENFYNRNMNYFAGVYRDMAKHLLHSKLSYSIRTNDNSFKNQFDTGVIDFLVEEDHQTSIIEVKNIIKREFLYAMREYDPDNYEKYRKAIEKL
jgi:hypothetical protein